MVNTENYKNEILELYNQGKNAKEIANILGFTYHQPVYNFFKKYNLEHKERKYKRKYTLNENYFKCINTSEKAYILGFICADGYVGQDRLCITLSQKDEKILHSIKKEVKSNQVLKYVIRNNPYTSLPTCNMVELQINSKNFVKPLLKMGLGNNKTYTLNSEIIKFIPKYLIRDFLRGYFDGDGNVMYGRKYNSGTKYNINICGNEDFLLNTYQKYFPSINRMYYDKKSKQTYIWKISSKKRVEEFLHYLYCNSSIHLKRKYKVYLKSKHAHLKPI
mgnify:CR=1 FL=1